MVNVAIQSTGWAELPETSRLWIYQADRELTDAELDRCMQELDVFMGEWNTHGKKLQAGYAIRYNRFIILAVDEDQQYASGCSIDSSVKIMKALSAEFNTDFFNRTTIVYKSGGDVVSLPMIDFQDQLAEGKLNADTVVFNNLIQKKAELDANWETTVTNSWHAQLLR